MLELLGGLFCYTVSCRPRRSEARVPFSSNALPPLTQLMIVMRILRYYATTMVLPGVIEA
jgi:hypothetical protein